MDFLPIFTGARFRYRETDVLGASRTPFFAATTSPTVSGQPSADDSNNKLEKKLLDALTTGAETAIHYAIHGPGGVFVGILLSDGGLACGELPENCKDKE